MYSIKNIILRGCQVTEICEYTFSKCYSLEQVVLSDSIAKIGQDIFKGCTALEVIYYSEKMKQKLKDSGYSEEILVLIKPLEEKPKEEKSSNYNN